MPNRIIKESIKSSEQINSLSWFDEVVFYRLIVSVDDFGRIDGRPALLKSELFPISETVTKKAIENSISNLASVGLLRQYEVNGKPYVFFPTWEKHQRIRNRYSKCPEPPENVIVDSNSRTIDSNSRPKHELELEHEIQSESESYCLSNNPQNDNGGFAAVMTAYMDKICAVPSSASVAELQDYCQDLSPEVCLKAIDTAVDANVRNWFYVNGVLRRCKADGITSLSEWDRQNAQKRKAAAEKSSRTNRTASNRPYGSNGDVPAQNPEANKKALEQLDRLRAKMNQQTTEAERTEQED